MSSNLTASRRRTRILCEMAILLALSTALSFVKLYHFPLGGSLTLLSMLPVMLVSLKYGPALGLCTTFAYSLVQLAIDLPALMGYGMDLRIWIGCIVFDYLVAFTLLGLAGIWRKHGTVGALGGITLAMFGRWCSHLVSGTVFFDIWMPEGWANPFVYSICYNGAFMLPELLLTGAGAFLILRTSALRRLLQD
jgi:thiamine transporter